VRILFVCTGNICRSPTAEAVFRHLLGEAGLGGIAVDSAGTHGYHVGEPPDERTQEAAALRGYDLSTQTARRIAREDFAEFDLILAMDEGHHAQLVRQAPMAHREKVQMFLDFAPGTGRRGVPDPYYGGQEGFELVLDLVEAGARGLLAHVMERRSIDYSAH
jgi:protein-tyrosine phosphatase